MKTIIDVLAKIQIYILILLTMLTASVWTLVWVSLPVSDDHTSVIVKIPAGASGREIGALLRRAGVIRSRRAFYFTVRARRQSERLKPGRYELRRDMDMLRIIYTLVRGRTASAWLTIPEGYTVRQIARLLAEHGIVDERAFLTAALYDAPKFRDIVPAPSVSLEGYLFPDTYLLNIDEKPDAVIIQMLAAFQKKVCREFAGEIQCASLPEEAVPSAGPSNIEDRLHFIVTMASLIEREAKTDKDRTTIASVLYNRLRKRMRLQVDATVQYSLGEHRSRLFWRDYKTPSDYNTYLHEGLPPGPIANPGVESIRAALRPAESDYLYYVARPDGSHLFTRTLAEHDQAIQAVKRMRQDTTAQ
ncbi:MAG: endolytic transglycosylase MltG [Armatimonadota bacterium]|nr:endolytic transglycosylase MltG [Armatimonadota bacterium]